MTRCEKFIRHCEPFVLVIANIVKQSRFVAQDKLREAISLLNKSIEPFAKVLKEPQYVIDCHVAIAPRNDIKIWVFQQSQYVCFIHCSFSP